MQVHLADSKAFPNVLAKNLCSFIQKLMTVIFSRFLFLCRFIINSMSTHIVPSSIDIYIDRFSSVFISLSLTFFIVFGYHYIDPNEGKIYFNTILHTSPFEIILGTKK